GLSDISSKPNMIDDRLFQSAQTIDRVREVTFPFRERRGIALLLTYGHQDLTRRSVTRDWQVAMDGRVSPRVNVALLAPYKNRSTVSRIFPKATNDHEFVKIFID